MRGGTSRNRCWRPKIRAPELVEGSEALAKSPEVVAQFLGSASVGCRDARPASGGMVGTT